MSDLNVFITSEDLTDPSDLKFFQGALAAALRHLDDPQTAHALLNNMNCHLDAHGLPQANATQFKRIRHIVEQVRNFLPTSPTP